VLLPVYGVVLVQSLATLEVEIWITGIDPPILPEGLDFPSSMAVLVHRQVESVTSRLTQCEGIVHGDFAVSCGEGLSYTAKVPMEGIRSLA
jgi:hypothetical protein